MLLLLRVRWSKHMVLNYRDVNVGLLVTLIKVGWSVTTKHISYCGKYFFPPSQSLSNLPQRLCLSLCLLNAFHCNTTGNESLFF